MLLCIIISLTLFLSEANGVIDCRSIRHNCDLSTTLCYTLGNGSFRCDCRVGFEKIQFNNISCRDTNECLQRKCDDSTTFCRNEPGSFKCVCKGGFKQNDERSCSDVDECQANTHKCNLSTTSCSNNRGSYSCNCNKGFEIIPNSVTSCKDINECLTNVCDRTSTICHNIEGGYSCECKNGFEKINKNKCSDINECDTNHHVCNVTISSCHNNEGSYVCKCHDGYKNVNNICQDINECAEKIATCDPQTTMCTNFKGRYRCDCKMGFEKNSTSDTKCQDVNECSKHKHDCDEQTTTCENDHGGYRCLCRPGHDYIFEDSKTCKDINECEFFNFDKISTECTNTLGSFEYRCRNGFQMINGTCRDVDECRESNKYDSTVTCINSVGSYSVTCQKGYYLEDEHDKFTCKVCAASANVWKVVAGITTGIAVLLAIIFIIHWKMARRCNHSKYHVKGLQTTDLVEEIEKRVKPVSRDEQYETTNEARGMSNRHKCIRTGSKKDRQFQNEFKILSKKSLEEIHLILSPKELTERPQEWKVYSVDGDNPNKYLFSTFPSASDVGNFWEICIERSNVIILFDYIKDAALSFLPNKKVAMKCKELKLKLTNTENAGIISVDSISAMLDDKIKNEVYENLCKIRNIRFSVIRVHLKNKDLLTKDIFLAIKKNIDSRTLKGNCTSIFVLSRNDIKLASFYVACDKLFDQIESHRKNVYTELSENVKTYKTLELE